MDPRTPHTHVSKPDATRGRPGAPSGPPRGTDLQRQARRRRRIAFAAVLFPLFFLAVIGMGIAAMYYKRMEFFKPPPSGSAPATDMLRAEQRADCGRGPPARDTA